MILQIQYFLILSTSIIVLTEAERFKLLREQRVEMAEIVFQPTTKGFSNGMGSETMAVSTTLFPRHRTNILNVDDEVFIKKQDICFDPIANSRNSARAKHSKKTINMAGIAIENAIGRFEVPLFLETFVPVTDPVSLTQAPKLLATAQTRAPRPVATLAPYAKASAPNAVFEMFPNFYPRHYPRHRYHFLEKLRRNQAFHEGHGTLVPATDYQGYLGTRTKNFPKTDSFQTVHYRPRRNFNKETKKSRK